MVERWLLSRSASLEQQVAVLRLLAAALDAWLFQVRRTPLAGGRGVWCKRCMARWGAGAQGLISPPHYSSR